MDCVCTGCRTGLAVGASTVVEVLPSIFSTSGGIGWSAGLSWVWGGLFFFLNFAKRLILLGSPYQQFTLFNTNYTKVKGQTTPHWQRMRTNQHNIIKGGVHTLVLSVCIDNNHTEFVAKFCLGCS